ncbi:MAG TPA: response regulator [Solirubrobacteraceae bacterium]|nr:response regulator [Solirubrobacteraceae bacterium]
MRRYIRLQSISLHGRMLLGTAALALVVAGAFLWLIVSVDGLRTASNRRTHSEQTIAAANAAEKLLLDLETGERGFVITDRPRFLEPWRAARTAFPGATAKLMKLARGSPGQERLAKRIRAAGTAYVRGYSLALVEAERRNPAGARRLVASGRGKREVDTMRALFGALIAREQALAVTRTRAASHSATRAMTIALLGLGGSLLLIALLSTALARSVVRPLERLRAAADVVAAGDLSVQIQRRGPPELAKLTESFNAMASSLAGSHAQLREATVRADEANLAKSEFLSRMSHELRTPLNAIIGYGQVLELQLQDARRRKDIEQILRAGRHLLALINDVLDLSRIEAGELSLSPEPVALAETLDEVLALVTPSADQRQIHIGVDMNGLASGGHVQADRRLLAQVLLNLLSNAIKYNRDGGLISVSFASGDDGRIRTLVTDTGVGIASSKLHGLFEPFNRLGAESTGIEGTGLGLALSKRLVEAMGGTIDVWSEPGHGSTFVVELAAAPAPDGGALTRAGFPAPAITGSELGHSLRRILYIEDNLSNLALVERILDEQRNVELIPAMQGTIGLQLAREHRPDLVVLDLHLPDLPGIEVLRRLQAEADTREIPVVILSADASKKQIEHLLAAGARDYVTKPLDVRQFLAVLAGHLVERTAPEVHTDRIMIVDDVQTNVSLLAMILDDWGYKNLVTTTDSSEAVQMCVETRPDLLLLDLQMPSPNGYEVMETLRGQGGEHVPILVLTAELTPEAEARARKLGASDFLGKPFDFDELRRQVTKLLLVRRRSRA